VQVQCPTRSSLRLGIDGLSRRLGQHGEEPLFLYTLVLRCDTRVKVSQLLRLRILRPGFLQDGDVGVGVF
jgi:hypothetical protein